MIKSTFSVAGVVLSQMAWQPAKHKTAGKDVSECLVRSRVFMYAELDIAAQLHATERQAIGGWCCSATDHFRRHSGYTLVVTNLAQRNQFEIAADAWSMGDNKCRWQPSCLCHGLTRQVPCHILPALLRQQSCATQLYSPSDHNTPCTFG